MLVSRRAADGALHHAITAGPGCSSASIRPVGPSWLLAANRGQHLGDGSTGFAIGSPSTGHYGFPSTITDDPVLTLAMPYPEEFEHAEERRLLYVALTRARRQVILVVSPSTPSPFAVELSERHGLEMLSSDGQKVTHCPICAKGILVERHGQYGKFLGCTNFPACRHIKNVA